MCEKSSRISRVALQRIYIGSSRSIVSQYQFSTLQKTKHGHHPTSSSLLKRNFPEIAPPDRAAGARTRQPENSKRAHFRAPALQTPPKFHARTPRERKKKENCGRGGKKKREILGRPAEGLSGGGGGPVEGSIRNGVQGSGFRVQFRFSGTKTETAQKQNEERDE